MTTSLRMELFVSDLGRSVDFYRSVLGFEVERHQDDYAGVRDGKVMLGQDGLTRAVRKSSRSSG